MNHKTKRALCAGLIFVLFSCGQEERKESESDRLGAFVGDKAVSIPARIQAENFNSAIDLTSQNYGHKCDETNNPTVDLLSANDDGGGCAIGWTQTGEIIDYFVENSGKGVQSYDLNIRIASNDKESEIVVESPAGKVVGTVKSSGEGYQEGWQNWVTRTIKNVQVHPGKQVVRLVFKRENNVNWLSLTQGGQTPPVAPKPTPKPQPTAPTELEQILKKSCAGCHAYMVSGDKIVWAELEKKAAKIIGRLKDPVSPMPPQSAGSGGQLNAGQLKTLLDYFSRVAVVPSKEVSPISTVRFESRGMKLQRDLMGENLGHIWGIVVLPDGDLLLSIKTGGVKRYNPKERRVTNISGAPNAAQHGQGGLLDIGVSPNFNSDRKVYLSYAKNVGGDQFTTALSVGELKDNALVNVKEIFVAKGSSATGEHFGGRIVIDDDSSIWLSVGERNVRENAQRRDNHLGKILRLTADGRAHPDNPFHGQAGVLAEIYSFGHRNPQGLAKNRLTNEIWESEHGPKGGDEINRIQKAQNFGWPIATFGINYDGSYLSPNNAPGTIQPLGYWVPSIAPSGLAVYSSDLLPGWKGLILSGALALSHLNVSEYRDGRRVFEERLFDGEDLRIRDVEQSPNGEVWYSSDAGHLFRIRK